MSTPIVTFTRIIPDAIAPMKADSAALGNIPTLAFQYCEAVRAASSMGWYVFPPADLELRSNGVDILVKSASGEWEGLEYIYSASLSEAWSKHTPAEFRNLSLPIVRTLPTRGGVQIWSGWLVTTASNWNCTIRPLVNIPVSRLYRCFEGVVETDVFNPMPLFMNIEILETNTTIRIRKNQPLFQVQVIPRKAYQIRYESIVIEEGLVPRENSSMMSAEKWATFRRTIRSNHPDTDHRAGAYGSSVRKRKKTE